MIALWFFACRGPGLAVLEVPGDDTPLPMVVAIHGLGDRPESLLAMVEACGLPVRIVAPRGPISHGDGYSWFDVRFSGSGATLDVNGIAKAADQLADMLSRRPAHRQQGKPIVTGFSQGGVLAYTLATRHPDLVALAVPIAGNLPEPLWPPLLTELDAARPAIHAFHGEVDTVLPVGATGRTTAALAERGYTATLATFPNVAHSIPPAMHEAVCRAIAMGLPTE